MDGLTPGRIVHYVTDDGVHLPAIVVRVWNDLVGVVNLTVFYDHDEYIEQIEVQIDGDTFLYDRTAFVLTTIVYKEDKSPRSWHWIERA